MNDDRLLEFLVDSWDNVSQIETELLPAEGESRDEAPFDEIATRLNSIAEIARELNLLKLDAAVASSRGYVERYRAGGLSDEGWTLLTDSLENIKQHLTCLEATGEEPADAPLPSQGDLPLAENPAPAPAVAGGVPTSETFEPDVPPQPAVDSRPLNSDIEPAGVIALPFLQPIDGPTELGSTSVSSPQPVNRGGESEEDSTAWDEFKQLVDELVQMRDELCRIALEINDARLTRPLTHLGEIASGLEEVGAGLEVPAAKIADEEACPPEGREPSGDALRANAYQRRCVDQPTHDRTGFGQSPLVLGPAGTPSVCSEAHAENDCPTAGERCETGKDPADARTARQGPAKILVVDDSLFARQLIRATLESAGYEVSIAASAAEAIEHLEHNECCDAVVCDLDMPHMDGPEFAQRLRSRPHSAETPLLTLFGGNEPPDESRWLQAGFQRPLPKYKSRLLVRAVEKACGSRAARRQRIA